MQEPKSDESRPSKLRDIRSLKKQKLTSLHNNEITCIIQKKDKFLSASLDGFIKDNSMQPKNLKLHYLSPSGASCACLIDVDNYAVASMFGNIHLFNLETGRTS